MNSQSNRFSGRVAMITGGNSGIGLSTALSFARQGAAVVIAARREEAGGTAVSRIRDEGGEAIFIATDVTDSHACKNLVEHTLERFGRLDFAFNNAGVGGRAIPAADFSEAIWDRTIAVNLGGVFLSMKFQIPAMLKNGGGVIVNNASVAGLNSATVTGCAYVASKHGVVGLTKAAAAEYADQGIRINVVCPAVIKTPMVETALADPIFGKMAYEQHAIGRVGEPEEVASVVTFLCSDDASFLTGISVPVDGGFMLFKG